MRLNHQDPAHTDETVQLLQFELNGGQLFAIPVPQVKEVRAGLAVTPLPNANPLVRGVTQVRGATFPVVDLQAALGWHGSGNQVVVVYGKSGLYGLEVEQVDRIVDVAAAELYAPPPGSGHHPWISGVARFKGALVEILALERLDELGLDRTGEGEA